MPNQKDHTKRVFSFRYGYLKQLALAVSILKVRTVAENVTLVLKLTYYLYPSLKPKPTVQVWSLEYYLLLITIDPEV